MKTRKTYPILFKVLPESEDGKKIEIKTEVEYNPIKTPTIQLCKIVGISYELVADNVTKSNICDKTGLIKTSTKLIHVVTCKQMTNELEDLRNLLQYL
ncbi:hypothetical protein NIES23_64290 (plasmid) [Trichormus variabilis NIES-23]|uniref:Uncharacterized protein n=1 Tax=Trichormus variabilis NIES-23 TaxID=1973479 RepID=A0A1Z4KX93_ANAVA|nr:hypothetical protein NIES23_64290 [Trichormus variabilis NIES-23]